MTIRKERLTDLIQFRRNSLSVLRNELNEFPWDSEEDLYTLQEQDILKAFKLFSEGVIDVYAIEEWANAIECREDVGYINDTVQEVINELANPVLYGELSNEHIITLKAMIEQNK